MYDYRSFIDKKFDLNSYDLSYNFIYSTVGIYAQECYPVRNGFQIIDKYRHNYFLMKICESDLHRYKVIYSALRKFKSRDVNVLGVYSSNHGKYFFQDSVGDFYVIFDLGSGEYKRNYEFNLMDMKDSLKDFYESCDSELMYSEDMRCLLTFTNELDIINDHIRTMSRIEKIISLKYTKDRFDEVYTSTREDIIEKLQYAKEFFLSSEYTSYCKNAENIKFIHGNLSNRSLIYENKAGFLGNFVYASFGIIIKDISILIANMEYDVGVPDLEKLLKILIKDFEFNVQFYVKAISSYLNVYSYIFKIIRDKYLFDINSNTDTFITEKTNEFIDYNIKLNNFIKNISFT